MNNFWSNIIFWAFAAIWFFTGRMYERLRLQKQSKKLPLSHPLRVYGNAFLLGGNEGREMAEREDQVNRRLYGSLVSLALLKYLGKNRLPPGSDLHPIVEQCLEKAEGAYHKVCVAATKDRKSDVVEVEETLFDDDDISAVSDPSN